MTKAVRVHKVGGPEALVYEAVDVPAPASGEVRIRQHAIGLNFIDVYYRTGLYKAPALPFVAGNEASGEVLAVGPGVTNFHPGDRVAYYFNLGGYASERNIPAEKLVKLPDHITTGISTKPIETSYDTLCAADRIAARKAYFEFDAQPAMMMPYTISDEIAKM